MAIKALFLSGKNEALTDSLYQWDYGQELEIEAADLGSGEVEVHFACPSMSEAIVKLCYLTNGIGTVTIPDDCLEQSSTITAWVYEIVGTQGRTRKVVNIPVIARTRPSAGHDIPTEFQDRYTELITEINKALDDLESGDVVVKKATEAVTATSATHAGNASTANHAVSADTATKATKDALGDPLETLLRGTYNGFTKYTTGNKLAGGFMAFQVIGGDMDVRLITEVGGEFSDCYSPTFYWEAKGSHFPARLKFTYMGGGGGHTVTAEVLISGEWVADGFSPTIYYQYLSKTYPIG